MVELRNPQRRLYGTDTFNQLTRNLGDNDQNVSYPFVQGYEAFTTSLMYGFTKYHEEVIKKWSDKDETPAKDVEMTSLGQLRDTTPVYAYTIELVDRVVAAKLAINRNEEFGENTPQYNKVWNVVIKLANKGVRDLHTQWEEDENFEVEEMLEEGPSFWEEIVEDIDDQLFGDPDRDDAGGFEY